MAPAAAKVEASGAVGPEPMTSRLSPMTSERSRDSTRAGAARRASCPPLMSEMCLRTVLISWMVAPEARSTRVVACFSSRVMPAAGRGKSAEAPPETRQITRSSRVAAAAICAIRSAPATPRSSGTGWPHWFNSMRRNLATWPSLTLIRPAVIWRPRTRSAACAMEAPALPAPITYMLRNRAKLRPERWRATASAGSAAASAARKMDRAWRRRVRVVMGRSERETVDSTQRRRERRDKRREEHGGAWWREWRAEGAENAEQSELWSFEWGVGEDGGHGDCVVVARDGNVHVGQAVVVAARRVERGEGCRIARQRPGGGVPDALLHGFERAVQPDRDAVVLKQRAVVRLAEGAAAEGQDGGAAAFNPANVLADDGGFDAAELGLAARGKEIGDGGLFGGLNLSVGIEKTPAQAMGEMTSDSGFTGSPEADHVESGCALQSEVHAVPLMDAMRASTMAGKRRMASTKSQPERGVTTVRASRSTPRRMASAHCSAVMAKRRAFCTFSGACPARTFFWNPVFT